MPLRSWTWIHLALAIGGYWVLVLPLWWFYTTRPARRARARAAADTRLIPGARPGEPMLEISGTVDLTGLVVALLGPPVLLVALWWLR